MYRIRPINRADAQDIEYLGTKRKFWLRLRKTRYLFKAEERGTGEDWAEKVVCELAAMLGIPHVKYQLAREQGGEAGPQPGVICPSFLLRGQALEMGNQLLFRRDPDYPADSDAKYKVTAHTVDAVAAAVGDLRVPEARWMRIAPPEIDTALGVFVGYILLDAWIANQDRHHQNWGAIRTGDTLRLAPTYDHGSSLARNLTDEDRADRLDSGVANRSVAHFAKRARSGFYQAPADRRTLGTVEAFAAFAALDPAGAGVWRGRLAGLQWDAVEQVLRRVPNERMSEITRRFTLELLRVNRDRLLE
jgi:hypothetical protein